MTAAPRPARIACAIYTRKSNQNGLERDYNSLEAQRDSCLNYIASQKDRGFYALEQTYDDPACTGGNMNRPAFKRLVEDAMAGKVNCIVVYKIDRFARNLFEALYMLKTFSDRNIMCRSVTEDFDTTTSHGTFMLHNLLANAEYQRTQTSERIRDKVALAKARGKHCGGTPPLGYDIVNHKLVVNKKEATQVRHIFQRFAEGGSIIELVRELRRDRVYSKEWTTVQGKRREGKPFTKQNLYRLLQNRKYLGEVTHKGKIHPGEQPAIVERELWDQVHSIFANNPHQRAHYTRAPIQPLLRGLLKCGACGCGMYGTYSRRRGRKYRYYLCTRAAKHGHDTCPVRTAAALPVEEAVGAEVRRYLADVDLAPRLKTALDDYGVKADPQKTARAMNDLAGAWNHLEPVEQARIVRLLVERIDLRPEGLHLAFRSYGLAAVAAEITGTPLPDADSMNDEDEPSESGTPPATDEGPERFLPVHAGGGFLKPERFVPSGPIFFVPLHLEHYCGRQRVVRIETPDTIPPLSPTTKPTDPLVQALVRSFQWRRMLDSGRWKNQSDFARHLGVTGPYVSRLMRLTLLAPDIVEAILDGRGPAGLSIEKLTLERIPPDWASQRRQYGFPPVAGQVPP